MRISTILDQVEFGEMTLPEFQRGYVWNRSQVRGLIQSLYLEYPVGGLLIWTTQADSELRRDGEAGGRVVRLLLDGQQRITSLYGVIKGEPPAFFQGNANAFRDLYFDVRTETFEFYGPVKMRDDAHWVSVSGLFREGVQSVIENLADHLPDVKTSLAYQNRLNRIIGIASRDIFIEEITGNDKTIDEVVEIFNRVNSGGTKLSKGDLALARISADRPASRNELRQALTEWKERGFDFSLDWILRVVTAVATGQAQYGVLRELEPEEFANAIQRSKRAVNFVLNLIADRLGLDHNRVLGGRFGIAPMARLVDQEGGALHGIARQNHLLYWYVHSLMWGRYSSSTESMLQQDLEAMGRKGIDGLVEQISRFRGSLEVRPGDFESWSIGSRFYPVLYMTSRMLGARDLGNGMELRASLLGKESALHVHHVFPKALLYRHGYLRADANTLANFAFLTASSNLAVGSSDPAEYFPQLEARNPGVLASQWIPMDESLWRIDRFHEFAAARRELMAVAANQMLDALLAGETFARPLEEWAEPVETAPQVGEDAEYEEEPVIERIQELIKGLGLALPELHHEVVDPESGEVLVMADVAWPEGVQANLSDPLAFLLEPDHEMEERLSELGYRFFVDFERFVWYLEDLLGEDIDGDALVGEAALSGPNSNDSPSGASADEELESQFHRAMVSIYERAKKEAGYTATYFIQMVSESGGLAAAKRLLATPDPSEGFTALWEKGRLDLTVEAHVLQPQFASLFSEPERHTAEQRLAQYGYRV